MGIEQIQTCHTGFFICLAIAVLGALLAVVFFFTLRIRDAWRMSFSGVGRLKAGGTRTDESTGFSLDKKLARRSIKRLRQGVETESVPQETQSAEGRGFTQADGVTAVLPFARKDGATEVIHLAQMDEAAEGRYLTQADGVTAVLPFTRKDGATGVMHLAQMDEAAEKISPAKADSSAKETEKLPHSRTDKRKGG